jgi:hypothetical protein
MGLLGQGGESGTTSKQATVSSGATGTQGAIVKGVDRGHGSILQVQLT